MRMKFKEDLEERSRIDWKAGCLETCTSGLGLGARCNSSPYTTHEGGRVVVFLHVFLVYVKFFAFLCVLQ